MIYYTPKRYQLSTQYGYKPMTKSLRLIPIVIEPASVPWWLCWHPTILREPLRDTIPFNRISQWDYIVCAIGAEAYSHLILVDMHYRLENTFDHQLFTEDDSAYMWYLLGALPIVYQYEIENSGQPLQRFYVFKPKTRS